VERKMDVAVYYIAFLIPAAVVIGIRPYYDKITKYFFFILLSSFLIFIIGLRNEIGGDWGAYLAYYESYSSLNLSEFLEEFFLYDPFYVLVNFIAGKVNGGIYLVNVIEALIFMYGYAKFSLKQKYPSLTFLIGIPYIVIVVSMGYTRQAIAIGFIFLVYNALIDGKFLRASILNLFAVLSHKSAIIIYLIILIVLLFSKTSGKRKFFYIGLIMLFAVVSFLFFLLPFLEGLLHGYIIGEMKSEGGMIRLFMNLIPSLIYILFSRKADEATINERRLWTTVSFVVMVSLSFQYLGYSTVADRINLYFSPIQMSVYGKFIGRLKSKYLEYVFILVIVLLYFMVLYIWLNYADHRDYWVPYKNFLFEQL